MDVERIRTVVLAGGSSRRMGFDKLTARFNGEPLARRVVLGLRELRPLVVATPPVAELLADLLFTQLIVTDPTAGPSVTLALADAALPPEVGLAVLPCDLPFLDAGAVRAFVARVPLDADLAWPVVAGTPGHPVVWSPAARAFIATLRASEPPAQIRSNPAIRALSLDERDEAYVDDVDTAEQWARAEARAARAGAGRSSEPERP